MGRCTVFGSSPQTSPLAVRVCKLNKLLVRYMVVALPKQNDKECFTTCVSWLWLIDSFVATQGAGRNCEFELGKRPVRTSCGPPTILTGCALFFLISSK
jgi:hypothetical protein